MADRTQSHVADLRSAAHSTTTSTVATGRTKPGCHPTGETAPLAKSRPSESLVRVPAPDRARDHQERARSNHKKRDRTAEFIDLGDDGPLFRGHRISRRIQKHLIVFVGFKRAAIDEQADQ